MEDVFLVKGHASDNVLNSLTIWICHLSTIFFLKQMICTRLIKWNIISFTTANFIFKNFNIYF